MARFVLHTIMETAGGMSGYGRQKMLQVRSNRRVLRSHSRFS